MNAVVLAGSLREANAYAVDKGIRVTNASTPEQVMAARHIIELPGFMQRRDRFTLAAARDSRLKYGKDVKYDLESDWVAPKPAPAPEPEPEVTQEPVEPLTIAAFDWSDEDTLVELKVELNKAGWTLKKLPKKAEES